LAALLAIASCEILRVDTPWLAIGAIFCITIVTMVQNDWRDRHHDALKGKVLALTKPKAFLSLLLVLWTVSCTLIILASVGNMYAGALLLFMALVALVYSETRQVPLLPTILVAVASASSVLLPLATRTTSGAIDLFFVSVLLIVFGREIFCDIQDKDIDGGYKVTLPLLVGERRAKAIAVIAIVCGLVLVATIEYVVLPGVLLTCIGLMILVKNSKQDRGRLWFDAGSALVILSLIAFG